MKYLKNIIDYYENANITIAVDSYVGGYKLQQIAESLKKEVKYLIEVDTGLKRGGVSSGEKTLNLIKKLNAFHNLKFAGIFTPAGHVYGFGAEKVKEFGCQEGKLMSETVVLIRNKTSYEDFKVSVGSTPTVWYSAKYPHINEIRPGNYVFYQQYNRKIPG
ncbi:alanine racemase [Natranaerobius trueperi]|uniref:alanine racemase n=1 Tax=Natranaerobius trueperi TaxID=759412 RepID=UPI0013031795|nr:alanine racemase [Natranaerobius trueperi]